MLGLTGGLEDAFPAGAWNWWYGTLLPGTLAVMCYLSIAKDKKNHYYNLKSLFISGKKLILGKILYIGLGLFTANIIIFVGATIGGAIFGTTIPVSGAVAAIALLTISYLWEIPVYWWIFPPSIPIRLMCPTLGLLPNGLPIPDGSELLNVNVILPGILLSLVWFIICTILFEIWFEKMEVK